MRRAEDVEKRGAHVDCGAKVGVKCGLPMSAGLGFAGERFVRRPPPRVKPSLVSDFLYRCDGCHHLANLCQAKRGRAERYQRQELEVVPQKFEEASKSYWTHLLAAVIRKRVALSRQDSATVYFDISATGDSRPAF